MPPQNIGSFRIEDFPGLDRAVRDLMRWIKSNEIERFNEKTYSGGKRKKKEKIETEIKRNKYNFIFRNK